MAAFVHSVYFWLSPATSAEQRAAFVEGMRALGSSEHVAACRVGVPASAATRDVVDASWDYQLICEFASADAHDRYQSPEDPVHAAFIDEFASLWSRVQVMDSTPA